MLLLKVETKNSEKSRGGKQMNECDKLVLLAELEGEHCHLNHGSGINTLSIPALDYIVLPIGKYQDEVVSIQKREMVIPICIECADALLGDEWTLLYCFECGANRWVYREWAKNAYRHHVLWLRGCPDCTGKFGGLYFNDQPTADVPLLKYGGCV